MKNSVFKRLVPAVLLWTTMSAQAEQSVVLTEDLQLKIPNLVFPSETGDIQLWSNLRFVPTDDGSLWWEVEDYDTRDTRAIQITSRSSPRNNVASLQCLMRTEPVLTPDLQLCLPEVSYQSSVFWWANLAYVPSDDGKIRFRLDDFGGIGDTIETNPYHRIAQEQIQHFASRYLIFRSPLPIGGSDSTAAPVVSYTPRESDTLGAALANLANYFGAANRNFQIGAYKRVLLERLIEQIELTQFETFQELEDFDNAMPLLDTMENFYDNYLSGTVNTVEEFTDAFDSAYSNYKDEYGGIEGAVRQKIGQVIWRAYRGLYDTLLKGKETKYGTVKNAKKLAERVSKILKKVNTVVSTFKALNDLQKKSVHTHLVLYVVGHVEALMTLDYLRERILENGSFTRNGRTYSVDGSHPLIQAIDDLLSDLNEKNGLTVMFDWRMIVDAIIADGVEKGSQYLLKGIVTKSAAVIGAKSKLLIGELFEIVKDVIKYDIKESWVTFTDNVYNSSVYFYAFRHDFDGQSKPKLLDFKDMSPELRAFQVNLISALFFNQMKAAHLFARSYLTREGSIDDKFLQVERWDTDYDIEWADELSFSAVIRILFLENIDVIVRNVIAKKGVAGGMIAFNSLFNDQNFDYFAWISQETGQATTLRDMSTDYDQVQQSVKIYLINIKNNKHSIYFVDEGYQYELMTGYTGDAGPERRYLLKKTGEIKVEKVKVSYVGDEPVPANEFDHFEYSPSNWQLEQGFNVARDFNYHGDYEVQLEYRTPVNPEVLRVETIRFNNPKILGYGQAIEYELAITHDDLVFLADFDMVLFLKPFVTDFMFDESLACDGGAGVSLKVADVIHRIHPDASYNDWVADKTGDEWHFQTLLDRNGKSASYVRLQTAPVTLGEKDQDSLIPTGNRICILKQPGLYYLVTYDRLLQTAEFQMPIKVLTEVEFGDDSLSFNFPKEMLPNLLAAPANLSAIAGDGQVTLSWDAVEGATSYNIYWKIANGAEQSINVTAPPYTHTGLSNGTTYAYHVTAINASGVESASSQEVSATPQSQSQVTPGEVFRDTLQDGSLGPEMVWIPAGTFRMGDIQGGGHYDERPVHEVSVSRFAMGRYEVTFAEYDKFAEATGRAKPDDEGWGRGNRPVINVSWHDATAYAEWLSGQTGHSYQLPTEAEWEYAARAGTETKYWWGNDIGTNKANCRNSSCGDSFNYTAPVGSFDANPFGIYDTAGNIWEWVQDIYSSDYYSNSIYSNPTGPFTGSDRVLRGGGRDSPAPNCRAANRNDISPDYRYNDIGFRLLRAP